MRGLVLTIVILFQLLTIDYVAASPQNDLQRLIDGAEPGSVIVLQPRKYVGPVCLWKSIAIIGTLGAVIDGRGVSDVLVIESDNVVVQNLKIVNSYQDVAFEPAGIKVSGSRNVTIADNIIEGVIHGVYVVNSSNVMVARNRIRSLVDRDLSDRGHGVYLWYTRGAEISDNVIEYTKDGIYTDHSYSVLIANNSVTYSRYGTRLMYSGNHTIVSNNYRKNLVGMAIMYSCGINVSVNVLEENRGTSVSEGIFLRESCDVTLSRNLIVGNAVGINIVATPYPRERLLEIKNNVVAFNNIGLMVTMWASGIVAQNDLIENAQQFYPMADSAVSLVWRGNFWSNRRFQLGHVYMLADPMESLVDAHPLIRAFMHGPGYTALSMMRAVVEINPKIKAIDEKPARSPSLAIQHDNQTTLTWPFAAGLLTFIPMTVIIVAWRNARRRTRGGLKVVW
jgi:nitrous oxidase accessory protein